MGGDNTRTTSSSSHIVVKPSCLNMFFVALQYINLSCEPCDISNLDAPGDPNTRRRGIMFPSKKDVGTVFAPLTPNYTTMHLIVREY